MDHNNKQICKARNVGSWETNLRRIRSIRSACTETARVKIRSIDSGTAVNWLTIRYICKYYFTNRVVNKSNF